MTKSYCDVCGEPAVGLRMLQNVPVLEMATENKIFASVALEGQGKAARPDLCQKHLNEAMVTLAGALCREAGYVFSSTVEPA